jgi:hypothetical protein
VRLVFIAQVVGSPNKYKGVTQMTLTDIQKVNLTIQPVDAKGNPATVPVPPTWTSSDATILTVTPAADGLSAVALAVGPLGTAQVTVKVQPDIDPSVPALVGTLDVEVVGSDAVSLSIKADAPVNQ